MNNVNSLNVYQVAGEISEKLKRNGTFDAFRKECLADVDSKTSYQTLRYRVEGAVSRFLESQRWHANLNKNQLRESLRKHIVNSSFLSSGIDEIVNQVVRSQLSRLIKPQIDAVVQEVLEEPITSNEKVSETKQKESKGAHRQKVEPITVEDLLNVSVPLEDKGNSGKHLNNGASAQPAVVQSDMDQTVDMEIDESDDGASGVADTDDVSEIQLPPDDDNSEALVTSDGDIMYVVDEVEEEVYEEGADELVEETYTVSAAVDDSQPVGGEETKMEGDDQADKHRSEYSDSQSDVSVSSVHTSDLSSDDEEDKSQQDNDDQATEGDEVSTDTEATGNSRGNDSLKHKNRIARKVRLESQSSNLPKEDGGQKIREKRERQRERKLLQKKRDKRRMQEEAYSAANEAQVVEFNAYVSTVNTVEDGMETVTVEVIEGTDSQNCTEPDDSSSSSSEDNPEEFIATLSPSDVTETKSRDKSRSQRYDESDLYKPRLQLHSSRTRAQNRSADNDERSQDDDPSVTARMTDSIAATDNKIADQPKLDVVFRERSDEPEERSGRVGEGRDSGWQGSDDCDTSGPNKQTTHTEENCGRSSASASEHADKSSHANSRSDMKHKNRSEKGANNSENSERRLTRQQDKSREDKQDNRGLEQQELEEGEVEESVVHNRKHATIKRRVTRKRRMSDKSNSISEEGELKSVSSSPQPANTPSTPTQCEVIGRIEDRNDSPKEAHTLTADVHKEESSRQDDQLSTEELNATNSETCQSAESVSDDHDGHSERGDDKHQDDIDASNDSVEHATRSRRSKPQVATRLTRSGRKQSQEELLPPAKRLRSANK